MNYTTKLHLKIWSLFENFVICTEMIYASSRMNYIIYTVVLLVLIRPH